MVFIGNIFLGLATKENTSNNHQGIIDGQSNLNAGFFRKRPANYPDYKPLTRKYFEKDEITN